MGRKTKKNPELGDARARLLEAAVDMIRRQGFAATTVNELCEAAAVTKGSFFHHFDSKEDLGIAAADFWRETTTAFFSEAPYHRSVDPLDRVLDYVAFRSSIIGTDVAAASCLVGTMAEEVHCTFPAIRDACGRSIFGHAATLEDDIAAAINEHGVVGLSPAGLARHTQAVIQGAFVLAKAGNDTALARESIAHLDRYIRLLFDRPPRESAA